MDNRKVVAFRFVLGAFEKGPWINGSPDEGEHGGNVELAYSAAAVMELVDLLREIEDAAHPDGVVNQKWLFSAVKEAVNPYLEKTNAAE